jgi:tetratricopeptide (TPR) repeat protein
VAKNRKTRAAKKKPQGNPLRINAQKHCALAQALHKQQKYVKALLAFDQAIADYRKLAIKPTEQNQLELAQVLFDAAAASSDSGALAKALSIYDECADIFTTLAQSDAEQYLPRQASALCFAGNIHMQMDNDEAALKPLEAARVIQNKFAEEAKYLPDLQMTLTNIGLALEKTGAFAKALKIYAELLVIDKQLLPQDPQYYIEYLAMTLHSIIEVFIEIEEFEQAMDYCEQAQTIYQQFESDFGSSNANNQAELNGYFGRLHFLLDQQETSNKSYGECLSLYYALASAAPDLFLPKVAQTLIMWGSAKASRTEYDAAKSNFEEALSIYEKLALDNPQVYVLNLDDALRNMAALLAEMGESDEAQQYLDRTGT